MEPSGGNLNASGYALQMSAGAWTAVSPRLSYLVFIVHEKIIPDCGGSRHFVVMPHIPYLVSPQWTSDHDVWTDLAIVLRTTWSGGCLL